MIFLHILDSYCTALLFDCSGFRRQFTHAGRAEDACHETMMRGIGVRADILDAVSRPPLARQYTAADKHITPHTLLPRAAALASLQSNRYIIKR